MIQTSEYCGVGHPDRTCDYIASYILDRHLERDRNARVALEVQLKDAFCTVSGEVTCARPFTDEESRDSAARPWRRSATRLTTSRFSARTTASAGKTSR